MATPETMWSTPKVTVATRVQQAADRADERRRTSSPAQDPTVEPAQPAPQVPRIIMPSRPMLTTPARSDHRPPRPARPIGTASPMAALMRPGGVESAGRR